MPIQTLPPVVTGITMQPPPPPVAIQTAAPVPPPVQVVEKIVEKPVYIDRIVEKVVEKIVEKPVYIDRPMQQMPQSVEIMNYGGYQQSYGGPQEMMMKQDHHHIIERPVYIEVNRDRATDSQNIVRDVEIVERPVYIETPIPVPFERPVPVPVPMRELQKQSYKDMYTHQYGIPGDDFPYHNPYPEIGCDFTGRKLEATNEPDPIKGFLEKFKPFG